MYQIEFPAPCIKVNFTEEEYAIIGVNIDNPESTKRFIGLMIDQIVSKHSAPAPAPVKATPEEIFAAEELGLVEREGRIMVGSRAVAKTYGKMHSNVLRIIKNLECSPEFAQINFELGGYTDKNGQRRPQYFMTRDGFTYLVMGFTGQHAARFKEAYISAFNAMEKALSSRQMQALK